MNTFDLMNQQVKAIHGSQLPDRFKDQIEYIEKELDWDDKNKVLFLMISKHKNEIGKVLINGPYPFALIKLYDPEFSVFKDKKLKINSNNVEIISWKTPMKILIGLVNTLGKLVLRILCGVYWVVQ